MDKYPDSGMITKQLSGSGKDSFEEVRKAA
jgi:hypothetical protein